MMEPVDDPRAQPVVVPRSSASIDDEENDGDGLISSRVRAFEAMVVSVES